MPFDATVLKVLIGSPSDVQEERRLIPQIIHDWTDDNGEAEKIFLLPIRWERQSAPELGERGQGLLNKHLVHPSDVLIALFWSKLGSDTGKEESGTVEEIREFLKDGKLVMVYFCDRAIPQKQIDHAQMEKLKKFKEEMQKSGIYHTYTEVSDLRTEIPRHLSSHMRRLRTEMEKKQIEIKKSEPVPLPATVMQISGRGKSDRTNIFIDSMNRAIEEERLSKERVKKERAEFEQMVLEGKFHNFKMTRGVLALSILPFHPTKERIVLNGRQDAELMEYLAPNRPSRGMRTDRYRTGVSVSVPFEKDAQVDMLTSFFERGSIFSVQRWLPHTLPENEVAKWPPYDHWRFFVEDVRRYLATLKTLSVPSPWTIGLSLFQFQNSYAITDRSQEYSLTNYGRVNNEADIIIDSVVVEKKTELTTKNVYDLLRPIYRDIWMQYGYPGIPIMGSSGSIEGYEPETLSEK